MDSEQNNQQDPQNQQKSQSRDTVQFQNPNLRYNKPNRQRPPKQQQSSGSTVSIIPLGGVGDVTKNMYVYEFGNEMLLVDCGIGFADNNTPGVDFMIPDTTYIRKSDKKIVGMMLTHGHEDHIGALPFVLPTLPEFPIYASGMTAAMANAKLKDFGMKEKIQPLKFSDTIQLGSFKISLVHITHSVPEAANYFIRTPVGNFYHGSDYKIDFNPPDQKPSDLRKIARFGDEGVLCMLSDSVGAERFGVTPAEMPIQEKFEDEIRKAKGRVYITTYSSNVSRMQQAVQAALKNNRKICFIGRSFLKMKELGKQFGYLNYPPKAEIKPHEVKKFRPDQIMILLAGGQGQVESGLVRIATGEDRDLQIQANDTVIFSSTTIPGNEINVNSLIDMLSKRGARVLYSEIAPGFHVSGHGSEYDIKLLMSLTDPKLVMPMGGTYKQMLAFRNIAVQMGYSADKVVMTENGQEVIFDKNGFRLGRRVSAAPVYVDEVTGEEVDDYIVLDRMKISNEGIVIAMVEVNVETGEIVNTPDIITKGFTYSNKEELAQRLGDELRRTFAKQAQVANWRFYKKMIQEKMEQILYKEHREPMVIPIVVEV